MLTIAANATTYIVKKGDTLSQISQMVTGTYKNYPVIAKKNNILDPNYIIIGEIIVIPDYLVKNGYGEKKSIAEIPSVKKTVKIVDTVSADDSTKEKFPELKKENLKDISEKIMNKIEKMRKERQKVYLKRELIKNGKSVDKILIEDKIAEKEKTIEKPEENIEDTSDEDNIDNSGYIVRLDNTAMPLKDKNIEKHGLTYDIPNTKKGIFGIELGSAFSHEPIDTAGSDIFPGIGLRYFNTDISCLGIRYSVFDNSENNIKFEYNKLTAFYRYFPKEWMREKNNFFIEGGVSYIDSDYTLLVSNAKLNDKVSEFELSIGDEYFFTKNFSTELSMTSQIAKADYDYSGSIISENMNDTYFGVKANIYF